MVKNNNTAAIIPITLDVVSEKYSLGKVIGYNTRNTKIVTMKG